MAAGVGCGTASQTWWQTGGRKNPASLPANDELVSRRGNF